MKPPRRDAWAGAAAYLLFGGLWIFFSDALLASLVRDPELLTRYQTWKGWFYVALTALLAWWLLSRAAQAERGRTEAVRETDELAAHAPVGIARLAPDGRFQSANARLCELLGREAAALLSQRLQDIPLAATATDDGGSFEQMLRGTIDHCRMERQWQRPDGSAAWVLLTVSRVREGAQAVPEGAAAVGASHLIVVAQDIERFKALQAALLAGERRLRELIDSIPDGITVRGLDGRYEFCNRETVRMLGLDPYRIIGHSPEDIYSEASARNVRMREKPVIEQGATARHQVPYTNPAGETIVIDLRICPLTDTDGRTVGVLTVGRDVSEAMRVREALERSETSLRLALDGSDSGLWDWNLKTDEVVYSETFQRLLHYEGENFAADFRFDERLHPDDRAEVIAAGRRTRREGALFETMARVRCFDGQYRWFAGRGGRHLDAKGRPERFSGIFSDLTQRRQAEERARLAGAVLENTVEGVLIADADSRILSVNPAFTRLHGYAEAEVLGRSPRLLRSERHDDAFFTAMWASVHATGHWQGEIWNRGKDGGLLPELMSLSAVSDETGRVTHYVGMYSDISQQKASEAELDRLAHHDALTGLPNRLLFQSRLEQALREAERDGEQLAVLLLDLDHFKNVNDSYGHLVGDQLLRHVAQGLAGRLRHADTLARLGGDEFALLMRGLHHEEDAARLAGELMAVLGQPWRAAGGMEMRVGASVGICLYPQQGLTPAALLQGADAALYRAKDEGRGTFRYFADEMTVAARERLQLETRLRRAIELGQLLLHFQPQVEIASGRIVGAEALVRWLDPQEGLIPPNRFIPVAEATGLIGALGSWVLAEACRQGRRWRDAGLPPLSIAVNVSPRQFHLGDMAAQVTAALEESGFPAPWLELELTEGALVQREQDAQRTLQRLRALGVRVAIDDFGTGYSSLAHLKRFPLDVLKIDRSFIADLPGDADDRAISTAVIALGRSLGVKVLAEGVETPEQLEFLRAQGCDLYQGFLRSRPLPPQEFEALLRRA